MQVGFVFADSLGAIFQEYTVDLDGEDGPVGEQFVQLPLGYQAVPAGRDAFADVLGDVHGTVFGDK
ncbi:hypothetical protein BMF89_00260 [Arthrobacter sp. SRS-W-1-2016]|uniref:hypothetical protein n=1 Tax=Arthrobacter sp. SRS-W-1-2016 TaxID=1930254 RepID=UPI0009CC9E0E|nr:hypothetical protein [Arthrobacter sp. SRS-W-1-2016]OOP65314.1 hypothetical protein BMF89_00260 [Arthrobacter sp. SRS-W-1-2016]